MPTFLYRHRVRYRECDPMGVVYHGNYLDYLEYARTEAFRSAGLPYKKLEDGGVIMPVVDASLRFHAPAKYDDVLEIVTRAPDEVPVARLELDYEVRVVERADVELSTLAVSATVTLCFVDSASGRPRRAPDRFVEAYRSMSH